MSDYLKAEIIRTVTNAIFITAWMIFLFWNVKKQK